MNSKTVQKQQHGNTNDYHFGPRWEGVGGKFPLKYCTIKTILISLETDRFILFSNRMNRYTRHSRTQGPSIYTLNVLNETHSESKKFRFDWIKIT